MAVDINLLDMFLGPLVLAFGIICIITGTFTAYFGTGRSRYIGGGLIMLGVLGFVIFLWFTGMFGPSVAQPVTWDLDMVMAGVVSVIGALIGALAALGIFLLAIMRS